MTHALPAEFIDQMREMLGDEAPAFLRAMEEPPALALRLNPRRAGAADAAAGYVEGPVPWEPLGRYLKKDARPGADIAHWAGAYYVQEASAMVSAAVLDARPGERVLDLCAAPGGKSTRIAAAMDNRGALVSNDPEPARAKALAGNLERMGAANALVVNALPDRLAARWPETFDAVLVDAPCSGEGMFRRDPDARSEWRPQSPAGCAARQREILDCAARMLKPGGRLIYSTCTFNRLENEESVLSFLSRHPDFTPEDFALNGIGPSRDGMLRVFPHRVRGDGHFVAKLRKSGAARDDRPRPIAPDRDAAALINRLEDEICPLPEWLNGMRVGLCGDRLLAVPAEAPALNGIKVVSPGLWLMRVGRSHIEPEHPLAMAIPVARRCADLDDAAAARYLAGEALPVEGPRGWTLVTWRGMPLGWGKQTGDTLKNHLPKGLRRTIILT